MILVDAEKVTMTRPGRQLFSDLSVTVASGDRIGVVGLNGFGKSTLLRVLTGALEPESGVVRQGRGLRIATLDQDAPLEGRTVREAVGEGWEVEAVIDRLGMSAMIDAPLGQLSGGQAKRVALAQTLVTEVDLLVLDEPTNHLDIDGIEWLQDHLAAFRGGLLLVTHDRHLLDATTTRILEIDRHGCHVHDGGYSSYLEARAERQEQTAVAETRRRNLARDELQWLRRGAPARRRKPKSKIEAARRIIDGTPPSEARPEELDLHFGVPRLGDKGVELEQVGHAWPGDPPLFSGLDLLTENRERLGIVGANGTGKSTLLDIVAGRLAPSEGSAGLGPTVRLGYYTQDAASLDPAARVCEAITGERQPHWRDKALMDRFWFDRDAQYAEVSTLSGGERRRLQLVKVLREEPNVLLLDEPTNDLDIDTLRVLEDFLDDWPGALLVASHDRAFLERTVADVLVLDGEGSAGRFPGGLAAWEEGRRTARTGTRSGAGPGAERPQRNQRTSTTVRSASTIRHELAAVEADLAGVESTRAEVTARVESAGGDHRALAVAGEELAGIEARLAGLEDRWLVLSDELESR